MNLNRDQFFRAEAPRVELLAELKKNCRELSLKRGCSHVGPRSGLYDLTAGLRGIFTGNPEMIGEKFNRGKLQNARLLQELSHGEIIRVVEGLSALLAGGL